MKNTQVESNTILKMMTELASLKHCLQYLTNSLVGQSGPVSHNSQVFPVAAIWE